MPGPEERPDFLPPPGPQPDRGSGWDASEPTGPLPYDPAVIPPRRRRRGIVALASVLALLLILLVVADRVAARVAGHEFASTLQSALGTEQPPQVRFGGFPFLTQVLTSHYTSVRMSTDDLSLPGVTGPLEIDTVQGTLTGVDVARDFRRLQIDRFTGSARIGYAELGAYTGLPLRYDSTRAGQVRVRIELPGSVVVTGAPSFDPATQKLGLADAELEIGGRSIPAGSTGDLLDEQLGVTFPELIPGVLATGVRADETGLTLSWSGTDIAFDR